MMSLSLDKRQHSKLGFYIQKVNYIMCTLIILHWMATIRTEIYIFIYIWTFTRDFDIQCNHNIFLSVLLKVKLIPFHLKSFNLFTPYLYSTQLDVSWGPILLFKELCSKMRYSPLEISDSSSRKTDIAAEVITLHQSFSYYDFFFFCI